MRLASLLVTASWLGFASAATAEAPRIVTDMRITQSLVSMVTGAVTQPTALLEENADPHHFQLRPSQAREVANADLIVWISDDLSPWLTNALSGQGDAVTLELGETPGTLRLPLDEGHDDHDEHDGHHHGAIDPHLWLDTGNAVAWVLAIADHLAELDPENGDTYFENALQAVHSLSLLDEELHDLLIATRGSPIIMSHDAYGYLADAYDLEIVATISDGNATTPGAAALSDLRQQIAGLGRVCIFPEVNHPDRFHEVISEGTEAQIGAPLDPAGVSLPAGPDHYHRTMRTLAAHIVDCAG